MKYVSYAYIINISFNFIVYGDSNPRYCQRTRNSLAGVSGVLFFLRIGGVNNGKFD